MSKKVQAVSAAIGAAAAIGVGGFAIPAIADATSSAPSPSTCGRTPGDGARHMGAEKALTGTAAAKAKAAVLAKFPGATIQRMSAEDAAESTGAAYEAHVTKADGTHVEVLLDKNFKVISSRSEVRPGGPGRMGDGPGWMGGPGGPGGAHGRAEQQLSGTTAGKVKAAVLAKFPGATVDRASAEDPAEGTGAAYEAHATLADGSHVVVLLDKNFKVLSSKPETRPSEFGGPPPGHDGGTPGDSGGPTAGTPSTPNAGYGAVNA